jgi:hypothetical protein
MSSRRRYPGEPRCLRVVPRTRGDWIVMTEQQVAISEHASVTEAGHAVVARLREGDELVVYDCYHRSRRVHRAVHRSDGAPPKALS